jgi:serine/threonine-protein kinase
MLGEGSYGVVHKAIDLETGEAIALKRIRSDKPWSKEAWAKVRSEVAVLSAATSEHIVKVFAFGLWESSLYLAMEFLDGPDLLQIIEEHAARQEFIPQHRALTILRQIAEGLGAAHARGIIHDDIKPANIVIESRSGRPVLIDFGLAAHQHELASKDRVIRGTPAYMAPERFLPVPRSSDLAIRSDIYALGCTAFELFTGRVPFDSGSLEEMRDFHRHSPRPDLSRTRPELGELARIVARAMAINPADRFGSCEEFAAALADIAPGSTRTREPPPLQAEATRPPSGRLASTPGSTAVRILIVDDDPLFRRIATRCAQLAFFRCEVQVQSADDGEAALALAERGTPDLLLLDYWMPGLNGLEVLTRLRELPGGHGSRVLVVSGDPLRREVWRFRVLGVKDFLTKPVDFPQLTATIAALASREGLRREPRRRRTILSGEG